MKIFLICICLLSLAACNHADHSKAAIVVNEGKELHHSEREPATLSLNGNLKWKADQSTFTQVKALQALADSFGRKVPATAGEYKLAGDSFQTILNKLIRDCRMKGAEHEALHHWLEPLLQQVKALTAATGTDDSRKSLNDVQRQLELFDKYFEQ